MVLQALQPPWINIKARLLVNLPLWTIPKIWLVAQNSDKDAMLPGGSGLCSRPRWFELSFHDRFATLGISWCFEVKAVLDQGLVIRTKDGLDGFAPLSTRDRGSPCRSSCRNQSSMFKIFNTIFEVLAHLLRDVQKARFNVFCKRATVTWFCYSFRGRHPPESYKTLPRRECRASIVQVP